MPTQLEISDEDGIEVVGVANSLNDYLVWQFYPDDSDRIYFEYDDRENGGYNIAKEITIMQDGIHIVLTSNQLIHFYFNRIPRSEYERFVQVLQRFYARHKNILEVLD